MEDTYEGEELELLRRARKASHLSVRKIAALAGISDTRLRHILNGYQPVGGGRRIPVHAPDETLARIAEALNVSQSELEAAGRSGAADLMTPIEDQANPPGVEDDEEILALKEALRKARTEDLLDELGRRASGE